MNAINASIRLSFAEYTEYTKLNGEIKTTEWTYIGLNMLFIRKLFTS